MSSGGVAGEARIGCEEVDKRTEAVFARGRRKDRVDCTLGGQRTIVVVRDMAHDDENGKRNPADPAQILTVVQRAESKCEGDEKAEEECYSLYGNVLRLVAKFDCSPTISF